MKKFLCGDVVLFQHYCEDCDDKILTGKTSVECECGNFLDGSVLDGVVNVCGQDRNQRLRVKDRKKLIDGQDNKCYWCDRSFDSIVYFSKTGNSRQLRVCIDHVKPYCVEGRNVKENLVASCDLCNAWKSGRVFRTESECTEYLLKKWEKGLKNGKIAE